MLLKKLFRTLWQYKAQFISMVIMVALGIGVFLGFNVEWYSLEVNTKEIYEATGFADYRIYSDKGFSPKDLEAVKGIEGVDDATRHGDGQVRACRLAGDGILAVAVAERRQVDAARGDGRGHSVDVRRPRAQGADGRQEDDSVLDP